MLEISSASNYLYKRLLSLTEAKGLKKEKSFLLSGKNLVQEHLKNPKLSLESEIFTEGMKPSTSVKFQIKMSKALFETLDVLGTHSPLLVLQQPEIPEWDFEKKHQGLQLLLPVGDPANLGSFRG